MTKVRLPSCYTCGHEREVDVDKKELEERIQRLRSEESALVKLLDRVPESEPADSYRRSQLSRLIKKARDSLTESEGLLVKLD